jgi:hypothetical protein
MRIAIIGGREKNEVELSRVAAQANYELEFHHGHIVGRAISAIRNIIARADLVVIVTGINGHMAVNLSKAEARALGKPMLLISRLSSARLKGLVGALERRREVGWVNHPNVSERERVLQLEAAGQAA